MAAIEKDKRERVERLSALALDGRSGPGANLPILRIDGANVSVAGRVLYDGPGGSDAVVSPHEKAENARSTSGRAATKAGHAHEQSLSELHALYRAQGRADIRRRPHECIRVGGKSKAAMWTPRGPTGCDFAGLVSGGRSIHIEAKSIAEGNKKSLVLHAVDKWPQAERDEIAWAIRLGGIGAVVVDVRRGRYVGRLIFRPAAHTVESIARGGIASHTIVDGDVPNDGVQFCGPDGDYLKAIGL